MREKIMSDIACRWRGLEMLTARGRCDYCKYLKGYGS